MRESITKITNFLVHAKFLMLSPLQIEAELRQSNYKRFLCAWKISINNLLILIFYWSMVLYSCATSRILVGKHTMLP